MPVPKVGDVLGRAAAAPAADPADDVSAEDGDASAQGGKARDTSDAADPDSAPDETPESLPDPDGDADAGADPRRAVSTGTAEPEAAGGPVDDAEGSETDSGETDDGEAEAVPADAVPVGETAHPVQSLQTEMLFSMDESGAADIAPSGDDGSADGRRPSAGPAVEFSEAGSSPAGHDAGTGEQAGDAAGDGADTRDRAGKAGASQDDAVDD